MGATLLLVGDWGHVLGAGLFAALAIWLSRRFATRSAVKLLVAALSLTSIWLLSIAFAGVDQLETGIMESLRNCSWLVCLFLLPTRPDQVDSRHIKGAGPLYLVLALLLIAQSGLDIGSSFAASKGFHFNDISKSAIVLRMLWAIGALLLVQRVYSGISGSVRTMAAPVAAVMVAMWSYDLVLYSAAYLNETGTVVLLYALRGCAMAALAPIIALTLRTGHTAVMQPSRTLAWRGLGVVSSIICSLLLLSAILVLDDLATPLTKAMATAVLFLSVAGGLLLVPATRLHRVVKMMAAKHLFRHRYDYREQWMGFLDTIGQGPKIQTSIYERVVKAMADITQSSAGALFLAEENGRFSWQAQWNWKRDHPFELSFDRETVERMRGRSWVVDIAAARQGNPDLPEWLVREQTLWALVPLIHFGEIIGVMALTRPPVMRPLDWEDIDMLRAVGRQVAGYLAEARGQQQLAEARRFDEFNRRFAFIMHDIKNLVSQIALVARNSERHADKPEFQADMILTLKDCADKMNTLLARLSRQAACVDADAQPVLLGEPVNAVLAAKSAAHPLVTQGDMALRVCANATLLEQVIGHLVQNAIEASEASSPIVIRAEREQASALLHVIDHGCGMSPEFVRDELFRPFASAKDGGFGIGAYEARELMRKMSGRLTVKSAPGKGSIFTLHLPLFDSMADLPGAHRERAA